MKKVFRLLVSLLIVVLASTVAFAGGSPKATVDVVVTTEDVSLLDIISGESLGTVPRGAMLVPLGVVRDGYETVRFCGRLGCIPLRYVSADIVEIWAIGQVWATSQALFKISSANFYILEEGSVLYVVDYDFGDVDEVLAYYEGIFGIVSRQSIGSGD